jgi:hypothetical protein
MNWRLILLLSSFGLLIGVASLFGFTRGLEPLLWFLIFVLYAWWIANNCTRLHFIHAFLASVLDGTWIAIIHSIFFSTYVRHNPDVIERFKTLPPGVNLRVLTLVMGPLVGAIFGLVAGLFAYLGWRIIKKRKRLEE